MMFDLGWISLTYKTLKTTFRQTRTISETWILHKHIQVQVGYVEYMLYTKFIYNHLISVKHEPVLVVRPLTIVSPGNLSATEYWYNSSDWQYTLHIINIKMRLMSERLVNQTMTIVRQTETTCIMNGHDGMMHCAVVWHTVHSGPAPQNPHSKSVSFLSWWSYS